MISDCRISGRYIGKRKKGSYSTKPFVLEAKTAKINNEKYEKINKQVRNKYLWKVIRLFMEIMTIIMMRFTVVSLDWSEFLLILTSKNLKIAILGG